MTINLIQTAIYKPNGNHRSNAVTDVKIINRKKSKYITKERQETMREESKRRKGLERTTKTTIKQV